MQQATNMVISLIDKLRQNEPGTDSRPGIEKYPEWLRDLFTLMSVTYSTLWEDPIADESAFKAAQRIWYLKLRDFDSQLIMAAAMEAIGIYRFPPKPCEILDILKAKHKLQLSNEDMVIRERNRLLEAPRQPASRKTLEAKREMWSKLGMMKKVQDVDDEIARMDLQEK